MIPRPAGRLRGNPDEPEIGQIKPLNKNVDGTYRIVQSDPILQAFRKKRALLAINAFNKALHRNPPANRFGNPTARITSDAAFSHKASMASSRETGLSWSRFQAD